MRDEEPDTERRLLPLAKAMTPGMMMSTRANILTKVSVTCVRDARVTLQQLTATTNAADSREQGQRGRLSEVGEGRTNPLTDSEDADESDQHHGRRAGSEEGLHHVAAEGQGHVGSHGRPGNPTTLLVISTWDRNKGKNQTDLMNKNSTQSRRKAGRGPRVSSR